MRSFTGGGGSSDRDMMAAVSSDYCDTRILAANTAERHTIPTGAAYVSFSADGNFWAKFGTVAVTAAIPAADVTDGSSPVLNPGVRRIFSGETHVSLIADAARLVNMEFWN
jgi:hypothetical protein